MAEERIQWRKEISICSLLIMCLIAIPIYLVGGLIGVLLLSGFERAHSTAQAFKEISYSALTGFGLSLLWLLFAE